MTGLKLTAVQALEKYFGYHQFRPLQEEIIDRLVAGKDTVVIMPTGGGKSLCYQIPSVIMPGLGIVISPLIALMKDQVEGLLAVGIKAAFLNSSLSGQEQMRVMEDAHSGKLDLLYLSPEKLMSPDFQGILPSLNINLFAIDEAHCISSWGHDFRPEYRQLALLKKRFPNIPVAALTATADKATRKDIGSQLGLHDEEIFLASFDRPNLSLEVRPGRKKWQQIVDYVLKRKGDSGIVYCNSRKGTESLAEKLNEHGIQAGYYHAGMTDVERNRVQEAFINDQIPVICATIAFGMGIDKSNIRWVIHHNLPKNMESFYQEIGRAGRDGAKADTLLFFSVSDIIFYERLMQEGPAEYKELQRNKLKRLEDYARAATCRRKILLSYFGEYLEENCGNCDVCKSPPATIDGTTIAQMALSAVYRTRETVGIQTLVDVLRGSRKRDVIQKGYNTIKTYGAGKAFSEDDWLVYVGQLIHQGILELAFDENYALKLTPVSQEVLFENKKVELVQPATVEERLAQQEKIEVRTAEPVFDFDDALFQQLKTVRMELSQKYSVPPYIIFHDKTLQEMAAVRPTEKAHFFYINGVGETKKDRYGAPFLEAVKAYGKENGIDEKDLFKAPEQNVFAPKKQKKSRKDTVETSVELFKSGMDLEEISAERGLVPGTIFSHLMKAYQKGEDLDIGRLIDKSSLQRIQKGMIQMGEPFSLKELFEYFEGDISYPELRLGVAILRKEVISDV
ncbi:MAG: DNA helicase RecQ [Saprospiraceae bacterium]|nr:DNA helicase RecQ [Saprospiraceae bacterium]